MIVVGRTVRQGGDLCDGRLAVLGMDELDEGPRAHCLGGVAEHAFPCPFDAREPAVQVRCRQQVERRVVIT